MKCKLQKGGCDNMVQNSRNQLIVVKLGIENDVSETGF